MRTVTEELKATLQRLASFILHIGTGVLIFLLIALTATGLDFVSRFAAPLDPWVARMLHFSEELVLAVDSALFTIFVLSDVQKLVREIWREFREKRRPDA
jgi:hypothetical protein